LKISTLIREAASSNYWWDIGKGKAEAKPTSSVLGDLVKALGPAILGGLAGWHASQRKITQSRNSAKPWVKEPMFQLVSRMLKADKMDFAYDSRKRRFELPKGYIEMGDGGLTLKGPDFKWREKGRNPLPAIKRFLAKVK
jgi:hypothetical protein